SSSAASKNWGSKSLWNPLRRRLKRYFQRRFLVQARYATGVTMAIGDRFPNGIKFIGSEGWIFVSRGPVTVTASDPGAQDTPMKALEASDPKILESTIGPGEVQIYKSQEQHANWLDSIRSRKPSISPVEIAHRACSVAL
ncbi:MAG: hypothetical protein JXJ20_10230, partial [Anaerolineae bacterium]|nr:hypothetical protein [Anaerolineae bacterium]